MGRLGKAMVFVGAVAMLATVVPDADAASVRVRCEKRTDKPRSKVSVDGKNLTTGNYTARATSGANSAVAAPQPTVGDEVEFDFDSRRGNIRRGATPIAPDFIVGPVTGQIINAQGVVVASDTVNCSVR